MALVWDRKFLLLAFLPSVPGGLAFGNPIIMNKISGFLGNRDLCHWYGSSLKFKDIIEDVFINDEMVFCADRPFLFIQAQVWIV